MSYTSSQWDRQSIGIDGLRVLGVLVNQKVTPERLGAMLWKGSTSTTRKRAQRWIAALEGIAPIQSEKPEWEPGQQGARATRYWLDKKWVKDFFRLGADAFAQDRPVVASQPEPRHRPNIVETILK